MVLQNRIAEGIRRKMHKIRNRRFKAHNHFEKESNKDLQMLRSMLGSSDVGSSDEDMIMDKGKSLSKGTSVQADSGGGTGFFKQTAFSNITVSPLKGPKPKAVPIDSDDLKVITIDEIKKKRLSFESDDLPHLKS